MTIPQWKRAAYIIEQLNQVDQAGKDIPGCRAAIKEATECKFNWRHDCLLLAVYGRYKSGYLESTTRPKRKANHGPW